MTSHLFIIFCLVSLYSQSVLTTAITFTHFSVATTTQVCISAAYPEVCCIPLDLDIGDGHGYGWFIAFLISFTGIQSPETVTVVYGAESQHPCTSKILRGRQGNRPWQAEISIALHGGAGSASAFTSSLPVVPQMRLPYAVVVDEVDYTFSGRRTGGTYVFRNERGGAIVGRLPHSMKLSSLGIFNILEAYREEPRTNRSISNS